MGEHLFLKDLPGYQLKSTCKAQPAEGFLPPLLLLRLKDTTRAGVEAPAPQFSGEVPPVDSNKGGSWARCRGLVKC